MAGVHMQQDLSNPPSNVSPYPQQTVPTVPPYYPTAPQAASTVTSVNFAMPQNSMPVGPHSTPMRCTQCQAFIRTKTNSSAKASAYWACCILFFLSCGLCSCVPCCIGSCRKVDHTCPNCGAYLGTYNA